jgi:glycosyltransferase involved in cell wall biosynthesis
MDAKPHICFVAPAAWPVLARNTSIKVVGGAEVQQSMLARAFAKEGRRVSMICLDYGQPDDVMVDGVRVLKAYAPRAGIPVLRFIHPRLTSLWHAMGRADADIYYQRCSGAITGWVAAFCHRRRRHFVYAGASDADFRPSVPLVRYRRDKYLYRAGLRNAHAIVAQNENQVALCRAWLKVDPILVRSCFVPPPTARADASGPVLWVSTVRRWKRPELVLELARRLPGIRFRMIGGADDPAYFADIAAQARLLPNVDFLGFVPHAEIEAHFDRARLVINTSEPNEGFPNTFLQAWSRGIPTVSFVKPASYLDESPVRVCVDDIGEMAHTIARLTGEDSLWLETGHWLRNQFSAHHSLEAATSAYRSLFDSLYSGGAQR